MVRCGGRTHVLSPTEIDLIEAVGNYVEMQTARGRLLHRATLAAVEAELAPHGFVRVHRSRLVRRLANREVELTAAGDVTLRFDGDRRVAGSRRYRDRL